MTKYGVHITKETLNLGGWWSVSASIGTTPSRTLIIPCSKPRKPSIITAWREMTLINYLVKVAYFTNKKRKLKCFCSIWLYIQSGNFLRNLVSKSITFSLKMCYNRFMIWPANHPCRSYFLSIMVNTYIFRSDGHKERWKCLV